MTNFNQLFPLLGQPQQPQDYMYGGKKPLESDPMRFLTGFQQWRKQQQQPQGDGQVLPPPMQGGKVDGLTPLPTYGTTANTAEADQMRQQVMGGGGGGGGATGQGGMAKPDGASSNMFNLTGLLQNPNIMTRLGAGYELGGLMGALGLAFTDMNPNSSANQQQNTDASEWNRYRMMQNNPQI